MKIKYNNEIYKMYEDEYEKNKLLIDENRYIKLELSIVKKDLQNLQKNFENKVQLEIEKIANPIMNENKSVSAELEKAYIEIDRLKSQLNEQKYNVEKLECSNNKNSSNSGIPTSKELTKGNKKNINRTNKYNHRQKNNLKTGGQKGHKGTTLTKDKLCNKIKEKNVKTKNIIHYIKGSNSRKEIIKYKVGINVEFYIEKHIFKYTRKTKNKLPKEFYSDVTYTNKLKSLIVTLGNYYSLRF